MKTADSLRNLIHNSIVETTVRTDQRILKDALERLEKVKQDRLAVARPNVGRVIMKSPITKLATAAIVAIACLIGLSLWRGTESGIALADVLARIEKVKAVRFRWIVGVYYGEAHDKNYEGGATELISQEYGSKSSDSYEKVDPNVGESLFIKRPEPNMGESTSVTYFLPKKKARIYISHEKKKYTRIELDDIYVEQEQKRNNYRSDPVRYLQEILKYKYESLGKSTIDGIEVEGFRTTDPNYLSQGKQREPSQSQVDVKIWADVKTQLPVRYDYDYFRPMGDNKKYHTRLVFYDFQWDVPVDAAVFEPPIPDGYTFTLIKLPSNNEETAIQGLKQCIELFGTYPERTLDIWQRVFRLLSGARDDTLPAERLEQKTKGFTEDEIKNKLLMPIRGLERFGCRLDWEKKDPRYYGETVTPKDADKVLMRWKLSDNEYRVIYGDLHAETVTPAKLAELEAALPK